MTKIAIIGAGPIGMEAALYGASAGLEVQLFERGRIGENVRLWGHVQLFTEWERNRSPLAARLLRERGVVMPEDDAFPTGEELADYLLKIATLEPMRGRILAQTEVVAISRDGLLKSDGWNDPRRAERRFALLTKGVAGERVRHFDAVIDTTGVYTSPNYAGTGGMPAAGEMGLRKVIDYAIPDVIGADRHRFINKHTLIIGSGHSAASTLLAVGDLFERGPKTRVTWVVRRDVAADGQVYVLDPNDQTSGRQKLGRRANLLALNHRVDFRPRSTVEAIERRAGRFTVTLSDGKIVECDTICAHTGFRPDETLWKELQIAPHPATAAPSAPLAAQLNKANKRAGVGLSTGYAEKLSEFERPENEPAVDTMALLQLTEPGFYVLGIKSYGRDAGFLMQNGFRQVRDVYKLISGKHGLDLYDAAL
jgi:thioredoxin reductase